MTARGRFWRSGISSAVQETHVALDDRITLERF